MYRQIAEDHQLLLYPNILYEIMDVPGVSIGDGMHPNEKGHKILAKNIYSFIEPVLENGDYLIENNRDNRPKGLFPRLIYWINTIF